MEIDLQAKGVEDGQQGDKLGVSLTTLDGYKGVDAYARQVGQCLLIDAQMLATLLDDGSYLLLIHFFFIEITLYCDSAAKIGKNSETNKQNHNKLRFSSYPITLP
jgi:hypothetical protein